MQAVILAGGQSSRFFPFNTVSKPLVKIAGEPIISHTIRSIKRAGINDIILLTGPENHFEKVLGNGKRLGVKITYATIKEPTGMGDGLMITSKFIKSDFFLVNPQHVNFDLLKQALDTERTTNKEVVLLAAKDSSEGKYGVLKMDGNKVMGIIEKPPQGKRPSNLRIVGVYFLNLEFIKTLRSVKREHYSLEKALDKFAKQGKVRAAITDTEAATLKYPWDLLSIKNLVFKRLKKSISKQAAVSKYAVIEGEVVIGEGSVISENALIKGPCYIGKNVFIGSNTLIRDGADIEDGTKIGAFMEIKNSLILPNASAHSGFIGDSVVGEGAKIGAGFNTANVRLDRGPVKAEVKGERVDTGLKYLGALLGNNTILGSRVTTMPGVIIGNNVNIGPSTTVMENIPSDTTYYTEFKRIVKKNNSR